MNPLDPAMLRESLIESDRAYFRAGASIERIPAGWIARMEGLEKLPAGCVLHDLSVDELRAIGPSWFSTIEVMLIGWGCCRTRLYLEGRESDQLQPELARNGLHSRTEIGYAFLKAPGVREHFVSLRPVDNDELWDLKLGIHKQCRYGPDGYMWPPASWIEMEKRKSLTGAFRSYLIESKDQVAGTISEIRVGSLIRAKNIVISPGFRNKGIGSEALRLLWRLAQDQGGETVGIFAIEGGPGEALYQKLGMRPVARWMEWTKPLNGPKEIPGTGRPLS